MRKTTLGGYEEPDLSWQAQTFENDVLGTSLATEVENYGDRITNTPVTSRMLIQDLTADTQTRSDQRTVLSMIGTNQCGDYLYFHDQWWLIVSLAENNTVYEKCDLQYCKYMLNFKIPGTNEVVHYPVHTLNATQYNSGETARSMMTLGTSERLIFLPYNEVTIKVDNDFRLLMDRNTDHPTAWKVSQVDAESWNYGGHGLVRWTLVEDRLRDTDDVVNMIADNTMFDEDHSLSYVAKEHDGDELIYKILPFQVLDGINEFGLVCNVNVVPTDKGMNTVVIPSEQSEVELSVMMVLRYVLDHCSGATQATNFIRKHMTIYFPQSLHDMNYEVHFMIADAFKTYVVEFVNNTTVVHEADYMTNFYIDGVTFNDDGTVYTPATQDETHNAMITNNITAHGSGLERYNLIVNEYENADTEDGMRELLNHLKFTRAYNTSRDHADPAWYTEFVDGELTCASPVQNFAGIMELAGNEYAIRSRNTAKTWQSVHSVIYDMETKTAKIDTQESGEEYIVSVDDERFTDAGDMYHESSDGHSAIRRCKPYLCEAWYDELDYETANEYYRQRAALPGGACSSVRNGQLFGRKYDWTYDNSTEFIIHTERTADRLASVSITGGLKELTDSVETNAKGWGL